MNPSSIGVRVLPGQMQLMRIPCAAYSSALARVSPTTPCLLATYAGSPAKPTRPAPDATLTIAPPPWFSITGISAWRQWNTLSRLSVIVRRQSSGS